MYARDGGHLGAETFQAAEQFVYILRVVRGRAVLLSREERRLRYIWGDDVGAREEGAEGVAQSVAEAGVIPAVVGHSRVADDERLRAGKLVYDAPQQFHLRGRGEVAGVDAVKGHTDTVPVPGHGQHLVRQVAEGPARELARVGGEQGCRHTGALDSRRGDDRQRHGQRALPKAGDVVYGGYSLEFWQYVFHKRHCSTISRNLQRACRPDAGLFIFSRPASETVQGRRPPGSGPGAAHLWSGCSL